MEHKLIPVLQPCIGQEEIDAVTEVLRSGWLGLDLRQSNLNKNLPDMQVVVLRLRLILEQLRCI